MKVKSFLVSMIVLFAIGILTTLSYADIDPGTISGFWGFDDGVGETAKDSSDNKLDGNLIGGEWVTGKVDGAIEFDGVDDYVEIPDISTPPIATFACWFKRTGIGTGGVPRLHSSGGGPWALEYGIGNTHAPLTDQLGFYLEFTDGTNTAWTAFFQPDDEVWYHTAISYDGTWVRTYVDGEEAYSSENWADKEINSNISRIGTANDLDYFQGVVDEAILFNVALSEDDINSLMTGKWLSVSSLEKIASTWGSIKSKITQY